MDISLQQVGYLYGQDTPFEKRALHGVDVTIESGSYTAIIGHTGSGKSTLLMHLNGLLKPSEGIVKIGNLEIERKTKAKALKSIRRHVGIVFQFPEHQLFEETVLKDIMFGPLNFGVEEDLAEKRAYELIDLLGLPKDVADKSPFDLSGGQMRRVAIAGVLAFNPSILVLDEPTAGLDPRGRQEIMDLFQLLHERENLTTILVTHSMDDAAKYADQVVVMHDGTAVMNGTPREVFSHEEKLQTYRLGLPRTVQFQRDIEKLIGQPLPSLALTEEQLAEMIATAAKGESSC